MIIVDSREKKNSHILTYFDRVGEQYQVRALSTGDYMDSSRPGLTIDRKQDLQELAGNICTRDRRFWREAKRSHDEGLHLIVLIEHGGPVKSMKDVQNWTSNFSRVSGRHLYNEMFKLYAAYQVEFQFCSKDETGRKILELLRNG